MTFSIEQLQFFFCILVRVSAFIYAAPFFSLKNVPQRVKIGLSIALAVIIFETIPYTPVNEKTMIEYSLFLGKEILAGLIMGYFANIGYHILSLAGQMMDMEIGFSMVNEYDPITSAQVTITSNLYSYAVMLVLLVTNMHHYILKAIIDSFEVLPVGNIIIKPTIATAMIKFITDYFIIAFRIILPLFTALLMVNTILAILAKVAPQMNMFVIGMQLKVFIGLIVLVFMISMMPSVADFIFNEMMDMLKQAIYYMKT
ncbi:flagellar biosynthetic protein FliR [Clostridium sp. Marseille-P299]|uniref:flagellar biosynthetic protein FliR n=1 Tax=Clostridium sp. Marseille-P299 TaxID=1805477 RepID=UPI00082C95C9|nr:flagellar biosynthetic protein FliR [Clostridium sp. Marseille-P299]